jgi:hypothetical protein
MFLSVIAPHAIAGGARDIQIVGREVYSKANEKRITDNE